MAKQKTKGGIIDQLESGLENFFLKKLPALPAKVKEFIVRFSPWIVLIALVFSIPSLLSLFGLRGLMMSGYGRYGYGYGYGFIMWISFASMVLMGVALPGLFKRALSAWRLMFYSALAMVVFNLLTVNLRGLIFGTGISMYILFQIKSYYK